MYKIKRQDDKAIDCHKARLVAQGFTQQEGIDYSKTFNLVVKLTTVRLVLTIVVSKGWKIWKLDVHHAFLNGSLHEVVYIQLGFWASKVDISLFIPNVNHAIYYLLVYVDDILLIGNNSQLIHRLVTLLSSEFKLHDLGHAHYFLGIEVAPTSVGLALSQHKYVLDNLSHTGMSSCKLVATPASVPKLDLQSTTLFLDPTSLHQIISVLQYLLFTRLDI